MRLVPTYSCPRGAAQGRASERGMARGRLLLLLRTAASLKAGSDADSGHAGMSLLAAGRLLPASAVLRC